MTIRDRIRYGMKFTADLMRHGIDGRSQVKYWKKEAARLEKIVKMQTTIIDARNRGKK